MPFFWNQETELKQVYLYLYIHHITCIQSLSPHRVRCDLPGSGSWLLDIRSWRKKKQQVTSVLWHAMEPKNFWTAIDPKSLLKSGRFIDQIFFLPQSSWDNTYDEWKKTRCLSDKPASNQYDSWKSQIFRFFNLFKQNHFTYLDLACSSPLTLMFLVASGYSPLSSDEFKGSQQDHGCVEWIRRLGEPKNPWTCGGHRSICKSSDLIRLPFCAEI